MLEIILGAFIFGLITSQISVFVISSMAYGKIFFPIKRWIAYKVTLDKEKFLKSEALLKQESFDFEEEGWEHIFNRIQRERFLFGVLNCSQCLSVWVFFIMGLIFAPVFNFSLIGLLLSFSFNIKLL